MAKLTNYSWEELLRFQQQLPPEMREFLSSEEAANTIYETAQTYGIEEQTRGLADLVGDILYGFSDRKDFQENIKNELGVSDEIATNISQTIEEKVFAKVKTGLAKIAAGTAGERDQTPQGPLAGLKQDEGPPPSPFARKSSLDSYREPTEEAPRQPQFSYKPRQPIDDIRNKNQSTRRF